MKFDELRTMLMGSAASDWYPINRTGPTYHDRFSQLSGPDDGDVTIVHDSHVTVAVYKPDIDLTLAYGMAHHIRDGIEPNLKLDWSKNFADSEIREISLLDVFWRGSFVDRVNYVYADGGRVLLPLGVGRQLLSVTQYEYSMGRLIDKIHGHDEFDYYAKQLPYEFKD